MGTFRGRGLALAVVGGVVIALSAAGGSAAAGKEPAPGVTADSVKIGFITSSTGPAASTSGYSDAGCKARVGRANAAGGVNGRKVDVVYADDQTSANLQVAQSLVQNDHVYLVVNDSAIAFLSYRWLLDHDVPLIGGGFDGNYYGAPGNEKVISAFGNSPPVAGIQTTLTPKIMKSLGATKVAALGYASSPSSVANVKSFMKYAVPAVGLEPAYTNTSIEFGTADVGPLALGMKNADADGAYYAMDLATNLALAQALQQNGVTMKAEVMATGYGQSLLDQPVSKSLGPEIILSSPWAPVEIKSKATRRFQADLAKYGGYTGVPDFGVYTGYITCDLVILGLEQQGDHLDPMTFSDDLRSIGQFNPGGGLGCRNANLSLETYGKLVASTGGEQKACQWALQVKDGKFVVLKPEGATTSYWTGELIEASVAPEYRPTTTR